MCNLQTKIVSGHPFKIYNASAGSGKTFTLTKEYLRTVLSTNHSFSQILAVTFTNKAVNEMKDRILNSLFEFASTKSMDQASVMFKEMLSELDVDFETLRQKAKTTLKIILHNYGFFDISTIDKFTHRIIRTFAKDLKIAQNFEVILDSDLLLNESVDNLLEKVGQNEALTNVLMDFALDKIDEDKSWDISFDLNKIGKLLFDETNANHLNLLKGKKINDFLALGKLLHAKTNTIETDVKGLAKSSLDLIITNGLEFKDFSRETLPNHFKKIGNGEYALSKLYNNKLLEDLKANKVLKAGIQAPNENVIPELLANYLAIKEKIVQRAFLKNIFTNVVPLTVLNAIQKEVKSLQEERGQLSISEFNTIIANEIKEQPAPFIYERLGEKYRHYLIDEFQDTSELQWNNLVPLMSNALEGEDPQGNRGSLFLVGDAKQAIYRWRGGNAEQFLNLVNKDTNPFVISPKTYNLPSNYRSHEEIINFNNDFFTVTSPFLNNLLYQELFEQGNRQEINMKKGGYVQLTFLEEDKDQDLNARYCEEVLHTIQRILQRDFSLNDIAILVRDNKHSVILADYLTANKIPIISPDSLLIANNKKVRFLIDLLHFSNHPEDLGTSYNILHFLLGNSQNNHAWISGNLNNLENFLEKEYLFRISDLKHMSVYDGLELAIKRFDLVHGSDAYLTFLLDIVLEVEQKEGTGIVTFLSYWEKKKTKHSIAAPDNLNAVKIMSIHKSKGLEFPIVIFPFANSNIYKEIDPKLWLAVDPSQFNGFEEVLISKKKEVVEYNQRALMAFEEEQHKLELDAFNILYVAMTRAERALYIISVKEEGALKSNRKTHYSDVFIQYLMDKHLWSDTQTVYSFGKLGNKTSTQLKSAIERTVPYQYSNKENPRFKIITTAGMLWDTPQEEAISQGNLMHHILGLIETKADVDPIFIDLERKGVLDKKTAPLLKKRIMSVITHDALNKYFSKGSIIMNEKEIITGKGKILRPDRIVITNDFATIIDYKTGKENSAYKKQVNTYAQVLERMGYTIENKILAYINTNIHIEYV